MKLLVLILLFGLASADFDFLNSESTGPWEVRKIGSTNKERISATGDLRLFLSNIKCQDTECLLLELSLYPQTTGVCNIVKETAFYLLGTAAYHFPYNGFWQVGFCSQSQNVMVLCIKHTDYTLVATYIFQLLARPGYVISQEDNQVFNQILATNNIPEDNVYDVSPEGV